MAVPRRLCAVRTRSARAVIVKGHEAPLNSVGISGSATIQNEMGEANITTTIGVDVGYEAYLAVDESGLLVDTIQKIRF